MNQTEEKKGLKPIVYFAIAGVCVAVVVAIVIFAFATKNTASNPEKVAIAYADTIVQTGDGYNAYKHTLVSRNMDYSDFFRDAYMAPYINEDGKKADFVTDDEKSDEKTKASNSVSSSMYNYYEYLMESQGWDNYDAVFTNYLEMYSVVKPAIYGDEYVDAEYLFSALEANVSEYTKSLTGADQVLDDDGKTVVQEEIIGVYQEKFGKDYKLTTTVSECVEFDEKEVSAYVQEYSYRMNIIVAKGQSKADKLADEEKANAMREAYRSLDNREDIEAVCKCTVEVTTADGETVATCDVYVVKIGNSWYVDNTNTDTSALYLVK